MVHPASNEPKYTQYLGDEPFRQGRRSGRTCRAARQALRSVALRKLELLSQLALGRLLGRRPQLLLPLGLLLPQLLLVQLLVTGALCRSTTDRKPV